MEAFLFTFFSAIAIVSAVVMVRERTMIYSIGAMILVLVAVGGLFLLLNSVFLFLIQIIVYAGAVMVLFVFVAMIIGEQRERSRGDRAPVGWIGLAVAVLFLMEIMMIVAGMSEPRGLPGTFECDIAGGNMLSCMGQLLFTEYVVVLQAVGLIILVAMVGAVYLSQVHASGPGYDSAPAELRKGSTD